MHIVESMVANVDDDTTVAMTTNKIGKRNTSHNSLCIFILPDDKKYIFFLH